MVHGARARLCSHYCQPSRHRWQPWKKEHQEICAQQRSNSLCPCSLLKATATPLPSPFYSFAHARPLTGSPPWFKNQRALLKRMPTRIAPKPRPAAAVSEVLLEIFARVYKKTPGPLEHEARPALGLSSLLYFHDLDPSSTRISF